MTTPLDAELPALPDASRLTYRILQAGIVFEREDLAGAVKTALHEYAHEAIAADRAARQPAPPVFGLVLGRVGGRRNHRRAAQHEHAPLLRTAPHPSV